MRVRNRKCVVEVSILMNAKAILILWLNTCPMNSQGTRMTLYISIFFTFTFSINVDNNRIVDQD